MEGKYLVAVLYWLRQRVVETGLSRRSFSKYCTSLEKHDPVLVSQLNHATQHRESAA